MTIRPALLIAVPALALAACGQEQPDPDTSYEDQLPPPVEDMEEGMASAPDNDTIEGGTDEQVDAEFAGENQLPEGYEAPE